MTQVDIELNDQGTIWLVTPRTAEATDWIADHVQDDAQWWGASLVVEHRYVGQLVEGMANDGLRIA
jgi:hypothetical protein